MAKLRFKGALQSAFLPLVSTFQTRTVIQPQMDINVRTPRNHSNPQSYTDYSIPQVMYCENVLPTPEGFQSVEFEQLVESAGSDFDQVIQLRDASENIFLLSPGGGTNWIYSPGGQWLANTAVPLVAGQLITRAYVNGRTFVCYESRGIWEFVSGAMVKQTITGLTDEQVRGIGSSSNYLLAFGVFDLHWSSLIDPLDFVPSLTTGAGFATPQDVKARITSVLGIAGGFIVYTGQNAIAGVYTNNARAPFAFKEVNNAGGVKSYEQVTSDNSAGSHYAWSTAGLQKITIQGAEPVSAEFNDFLAGQLWENYDFTDHKLYQQYTSAPEFKIKLSYIASRWLVISYCTSDLFDVYNYALVYDSILSRTGKIKLDHRDCFFWPFPDDADFVTYEETMPAVYAGFNSIPYNTLKDWSSVDPLSKLSFAFLQADGTVHRVRMSYNKGGLDAEHKAVVVFGRFQNLRSEMLQLQQVAIEGVKLQGATDLACFVAISLDGYNTEAPVPLVPLSAQLGSARFAKRVTGVNLQLIVEGKFALTSYLLEVTSNGDR